jgi:hypothetical protein
VACQPGQQVLRGVGPHQGRGGRQLYEKRGYSSRVGKRLTPDLRRALSHLCCLCSRPITPSLISKRGGAPPFREALRFIVMSVMAVISLFLQGFRMTVT